MQAFLEAAGRPSVVMELGWLQKECLAGFVAVEREMLCKVGADPDEQGSSVGQDKTPLLQARWSGTSRTSARAMDGLRTEWTKYGL